MMTCAEAARLMSDRMNRPLAMRKRAALRFHLILCAGCRHYRRQLALMRRCLRSGHPIEPREPAHLDAEARARIRAALAGKYQKSAGSPG